MDRTQRKEILLKRESIHQTGFTLMELMVVMAIVSILAAIAVPSYQSYVTKANRTDATTMLTGISSQQEQFFLDNKSYTTNLTDLGFSTNPASTDNGHYKVQVKAATTACAIQICYEVEAVPQGSQSSDSCGTLTINSLGSKLPANCW